MKSIVVFFAVLSTYSCCTASCSKVDSAAQSQNNGGNTPNLGNIDNPTGLEAAPGNSNVLVKFENN